MHFRFTLLLVAFLASGLLASAQESAATSKTKSAAAAKATPAATPAPKDEGAKKPSFLSRLFRGRPTATPAASSTPTATPTPRARRPRAAADSTKGTAPEKEEQPAPTKPAPEPAPEPEKPQPVAKNTTKSKSGAAAKSATKEPPAAAETDPETAEKAKYDEVKARAIKDAKIAELKEKVDSAPSEPEARKELKAYNKALFQKMRTLEPSLKPRIDRMETAVMKQLDSSPE